MTAIAEYPSMLLPAAPPFRLEVPEGFIAHAAPHALAMVRRADGSRATTEHVTVTSELVQAGSSAQDLVSGLVAAHPTATVVEASVGGDATARAIVSRSVAGQQVHQSVAVHVMPTRYAGDVTTALTVVGTWPEHDEDAERTIRGVQDSLRVESLGADGAERHQPTSTTDQHH
ncbi:hypothetical protein SAMN04489867_1797 [Pedococcus dokdonensis]|uniref:Lipoprotein LpqN n=1 Tax=Pedococcus dokdonensis TaxID=443156 RepID=A0A1H0R083_9MICO|nr:hypothetical protein [Pedococcus dokdonensis]SDP22924.1 hypothetical protein SAMN04489867_1797 [Pedococcus dokdonensis]